MWPTWPGCPLPQFGVPHTTISDDSMSIDDQNWGPMPGVRRIPEQPAELAVLDLVADLGAELEVEAAIVDRPRAIRLHVDAVVGVGDDLVERVRTGLQPDVRHPDHREPSPSVGPHAACVVEPGHGGRVPPGQDADPRSLADGVARCRGRPFVVVPERSESARDRRVDRDVHQLRPVLHRTELGQVEPGRAGIGGLPAEDPVELDRVADGLVDLQRELLGAEDQRRLPTGARRGAEQLARLRSDAGGVGFQFEAVDELPPRRGVLAAGGRVRAVLGLTVADGGGRDPRPALADLLVDAVPFAGDEPLAGLPRLVHRLRQVGAVLPHRRRRPHEQIALVGQRHGERVDHTLTRPRTGRRDARKKRGRRARHERAGGGDLGGHRASAAHGAITKIRGGEEPPSRTDERPHPDAGVGFLRDRLDLTVAGGHRLVASMHHPGIRVTRTRVEGGLDSRLSGLELAHAVRP